MVYYLQKVLPSFLMYPNYLLILLVSGQVKEAETREIHLRNELRKHQIELPQTNTVWLIPY